MSGKWVVAEADLAPQLFDDAEVGVGIELNETIAVTEIGTDQKGGRIGRVLETEEGIGIRTEKGEPTFWRYLN